MPPKERRETEQNNLLKARLDQIVDNEPCVGEAFGLGATWKMAFLGAGIWRVDHAR